MSLLQEVLADLAAEGDRLDALVADLDDRGWRRDTPAPGWDVATTVAHLAWTDEVAVSAAADPVAWETHVVAAMADPTGFADAAAVELARVAPGELLARWRAARSDLATTLAGLPEGTKVPWFGPPMSPTSMATARFMETWAHGLDLDDALGTSSEPTDRIRHVAHLGVRTRDFAFSVHEEEPPAEPFRVELTAPSGALWAYGPPDAAQTVRGSAYDFCRLVTQRVHRADTDLIGTGAAARRWLEIAQAFAGPPGPGRTPGAAG